VSHVRYELGFNIPEDGILHSHRRENPHILHTDLLGWCGTESTINKASYWPIILLLYDRDFGSKRGMADRQ
jgi:hypothetical protein